MNKRFFNVDIHWDFHRSIQIEATSEEEAKQIVDEMMIRKELHPSTFEPDDYDWELDTTYQP